MSLITFLLTLILECSKFSGTCTRFRDGGGARTFLTPIMCFFTPVAWRGVGFDTEYCFFVSTDSPCKKPLAHRYGKRPAKLLALPYYYRMFGNIFHSLLFFSYGTTEISLLIIFVMMNHCWMLTTIQIMPMISFRIFTVFYCVIKIMHRLNYP